MKIVIAGTGYVDLSNRILFAQYGEDVYLGIIPGKEALLNQKKSLIEEKEIDDIRESPVMRLKEPLEEKGVIAHYIDPHVPAFPKISEHHFDLFGIDPSSMNIASDVVLLFATNHANFDFALFQQHANLIVDSRCVYGPL